MAFYWKNNSFPERLKEFLKETGTKNKELAEHLNVSVSTIGYWLSGKREPSDENMDKLCEFFGVNYLEFTHTPDELAEGNLRFLFKKHKIDIDKYERFQELEDLISEFFIDNMKRFKKRR